MQCGLIKFLLERCHIWYFVYLCFENKAEMYFPDLNSIETHNIQFKLYNSPDDLSL